MTSGKSVARALTSKFFSAGRLFRAKQQDTATMIRYTSMLDGGTCGACKSSNGQKIMASDVIDGTSSLQAPNPNCSSMKSGTNRCRCTWSLVRS